MQRRGESSPFHRGQARRRRKQDGILRLVEITGVIAAVLALAVTVDQAIKTREALADQQISSAWQILSIAGGGSTGKSYALSTLVKLGQKVTSVRFICEKPRPDPKTKLTFCDRPIDFRGAQLVGNAKPSFEWWSTGREADISLSRFDGSNFNGASLSQVLLTNVHMENTDFGDVTVRDSGLSDVSFSGASLSDSLFTDSWLDNVDLSQSLVHGTKFINVEMSKVNISGVRFCGLIDPHDMDGPAFIRESLAKIDCDFAVDPRFWRKTWFWADDPPKDLYRMSPPILVPAGCNRVKISNAADQPDYLLDASQQMLAASGMNCNGQVWSNTLIPAQLRHSAH